MDKKYKEIRKKIAEQTPSFSEYLRVFVLGNEMYSLLENVSSQSEVYIFSGVIRNFLLGEYSSRDLDVVVRNLDDISIPPQYRQSMFIQKNSFGGFKITVNDLVIDIWDIDKTWMLLHNTRMKPTPNTLVQTAFFNFSSIVYDVRRKKFIFSEAFSDFYETHALDVVNEINPNVALCIVNTLYYSVRLQSPIKYKLCRWIIEHYNPSFDFKSVQMRHFKRVLFTNETIKQFYDDCVEALPMMNRKV